MIKKFAYFFYILALQGVGFAIFMWFLGDWNAAIGLVVGGGAAALFGAVGLIIQIVGALIPKGTTGCVQAGIGLLLVATLTWIYEFQMNNGAVGHFLFPLSFIYIPLLIGGVTLLTLGISKNRKAKPKN
jgi:hypothetical protein